VPQWVHADERRLRQVLLNLLGNAMKFTDRGKVSLRVQASDADGACRLRFEVQDSGVGIPADQLESIFQPFEQVGDLAQRAHGAGLGLAISQQLVRLMGGDIHVESMPGSGSRFWFELAVPTVPAQTPAVPAVEHITGYEGPRKTVLVVDDVAANRMVVADALAPYGFEVIEAEDGLQGLDMVSTLRPDVVLMDTVMPRMDGLEATRRIRLRATERELPIIAMSAAAYNADAARCLEAGANAVCPKPIDVDLLLEQLGALLELRWTRAPDPARM
jgi:CheY-like chemotaxis protein